MLAYRLYFRLHPKWIKPNTRCISRLPTLFVNNGVIGYFKHDLIKSATDMDEESATVTGTYNFLSSDEFCGALEGASYQSIIYRMLLIKWKQCFFIHTFFDAVMIYNRKMIVIEFYLSLWIRIIWANNIWKKYLLWWIYQNLSIILISIRLSMNILTE